VKLNDFEPIPGKKYAFVFGHEVRGVSQKVIDECDLSVEVPQYGTKHSLNISVCAGILIWDYYSKLKIKK
jgi:tRNA G18 (ribose-2'-O)-methylase SpoU